ncbi:Arm DNA-binding domain-containing protein [Maribacter algarum]|uniref:Arm DNA-binding domain-containing protein n=1 Tax=Maribacter algarum (ex Zhang et al. 2020) TaxID=2578118 RepID=UPI001EE5D160|nr:Arm DNA-binding domain-containing protein [Maribacter algarum]
MSNSFAILSYLRTGRLNNRGKAPIYIRITVNGNRSEFSIKRKIKPENWNSIKGRDKGSSQKGIDLNRYIDDLESRGWNSFGTFLFCCFTGLT